jgi:hypothetical protein
MNWANRPDLTPAQQFQFLSRNPLCRGSGLITATGIAWNYPVAPTALSREYSAQIDYQKGESPKVCIKSPDLQILAGGRELPHVYRDPTRLCLYLPGTDEWHGSMRIDQTFVPWTMTWLFYFEEWLKSNDWRGGGEHPADNESERLNRRKRRRLRVTQIIPPQRQRNNRPRTT